MLLSLFRNGEQIRVSIISAMIMPFNTSFNKQLFILLVYGVFNMDFTCVITLFILSSKAEYQFAIAKGSCVPRVHVPLPKRDGKVLPCIIYILIY